MSNTVTVLHAADLHLDSAFEALSAEQAALRRSEQRELLRDIVGLAKEKGAQALLLSGDLLDTGSAYMETAQALVSALSQAAMPVFISPGNHDWYSPGSPYAKTALPENVHIFKSETMECVPLPELGLRVWGAGFTSDACPPLLEGFEAEKDGDTLDIMVLHGDPLSRDSKYNPITVGELSRSGMDYVALGHIHSYNGVCRAGDTVYAWPGCPEGRGFDERGEKGVILARVRARGTELEFLPLGGRRYETAEVRVDGDADAEAAIIAALPAETGRDVYRVILTGERETPPDTAALTRRLESRFFKLEIRDRTRPKRELWEKCGEDTLRGLFLTRLRKRFDAASTEAERDKLALAASLGLRALDNGEDVGIV